MKRILLLVGVPLLLVSCSTTSRMNAGVTVATTFYPLAEIARNIAGSGVTVTQIVPDGAEPHDYEPSPADIAALSSADVVVFNGIVDEWAAKLRSQWEANGSTVVRGLDDLSRLAFSMKPETKGIDPHVWLSPQLAGEIGMKVRNALIKVDPTNTETYKRNTLAYLAKLTDLDEAYRQGLRECRLKKIVSSHAAFGYLADAYGFEVTNIAGLSPDSEPSAKAVADIIDTVKKDGIKVVFFESLASPRLSETIAKETGAQTLVLDPVEGLTQQEKTNGDDYFSLMRRNLANLRIALQCK